MPPPSKHDPYAALRVPRFGWYILATLTLTLGLQIQGTVVSWQVYALTKDPLALGLSGLAEALPYIGSALWAGHVVDRRDRRRVALASLAVLLACAAGLLALSLTTHRPGSAHASRYAAVAPIFALQFVTGVARSFLQPARNALSAELVPRELFASSVAWRSTTWQTAAVSGPALGGVLYGLGSAALAYAVQAALLVAAILAMLAIRGPRRVTRRASATPGGADDVGEGLLSGLRFVFREPVLLGAMALDLFSVFLAGSEALLPVFAAEILHVGPEGLGALRAAPAAGAVVTSLVLAHRPPFRRAGRTMLLAVAVFALCIVAFGLSRSFWLSLVVLAVAGMADQVSVLIRSTLLQILTPEHMLGRVSAVNSIFIGSSNELGMFESGVMAKLLGVVPSVVFGGVSALAVVGIVAAKVPRLRRLGRIGEGAP